MLRSVSQCWVVIVSLAVSQVGMAAQLVVFSFDGSLGNEESIGPNSQPAGAFVSDVQRGVGIGVATGAGAFSARSWSTDVLDPNDYFSFSVTPDAGNQLSLSSIEFDERRSSTGIRAWTIRSSLDEFVFDLSPGPVAVPDNTSTRIDQRVTLPSEMFSNLATGVEFRIYGYEAESSAGTWRVDNLELFGEISAVPEPADWMGMAGVGLVFVVILKRYRRPKPASPSKIERRDAQISQSRWVKRSLPGDRLVVASEPESYDQECHDETVSSVWVGVETIGSARPERDVSGMPSGPPSVSKL